MTGFPSKDKPWLKYYSQEALCSKLPESSAYQSVCSRNQDNLNAIAIKYSNRNISYQELIRNIDKAALAFSSNGIVQGDIAAVIAPTLPEIVYSFYALNKIGAISEFFDPRQMPMAVARELKETKPKTIIVFEDCITPFKEVIQDAGARIVIVVSIRDSLPIMLNLLLSITNRISYPKGWISWKSFLTSLNTDAILPIPCNPANLPAVMEHTGGTTGEPKAVVLTNMNINSVIHQYSLGVRHLSRSDSWLSVAFPFITYALVFSLHGPLTMGMRCVLCFDMDTNKVNKLILKEKINHMANTPIMWERLIHNQLLKNDDLSFIINPTIGADAISIEKEKDVNNFLHSHNCKYNLMKGYGMTEIGSAVSICISNECSKIGSIGIPFMNTVISIFDTETGKELTYNREGEICISGPSVMSGYYNNLKSTSEVLKTHDDGLLWMHSGDLGHMDEDGFLYIDGRIKRMLIDHTGFKIFPPYIEKTILSYDCVDKCCVIGTRDKEHGAGQYPIAFIILKSNSNDTRSQVISMCKEQLPEYYMPKDFIFVNSFPYTSASKIDYMALEREYASKY